jgi:hypothetical protein
MEEIKEEYQLLKEIVCPLVKSKTLLKEVKRILPIISPVMMLKTNNGEIKWFEGIKEGENKYLGCNGKEKKVEINNRSLYSMTWGEQVLRTFVVQEDSYLPDPQQPILFHDEVELMANAYVTNAEFLKNKGKQITAESKRIMTIAKSILLVIGGLLGIIIISNYLGFDILGYLQSFAQPEEIIEKVIENSSSLVTIN